MRLSTLGLLAAATSIHAAAIKPIAVAEGADDSVSGSGAVDSSAVKSTRDVNSDVGIAEGYSKCVLKEIYEGIKCDSWTSDAVDDSASATIDTRSITGDSTTISSSAPSTTDSATVDTLYELCVEVATKNNKPISDVCPEYTSTAIDARSVAADPTATATAAIDSASNTVDDPEDEDEVNLQLCAFDPWNCSEDIDTAIDARSVVDDNYDPCNDPSALPEECFDYIVTGVAIRHPDSVADDSAAAIDSTTSGSVRYSAPNDQYDVCVLTMSPDVCAFWFSGAGSGAADPVISSVAALPSTATFATTTISTSVSPSPTSSTSTSTSEFMSFPSASSFGSVLTSIISSASMRVSGTPAAASATTSKGASSSGSGVVVAAKATGSAGRIEGTVMGVGVAALLGLVALL